MSEKLYKLIELINGEKRYKFISYNLGQRIKMFLLVYFIR